MKKIEIQKLRLLNFKGVREFEMNATCGNVSVCGRNGSGKTTLFDAFTWLLFGKDSKDRKVFNIRTLGADGKVIERLPHEVEATLAVYDTESEAVQITLRRCFRENWVKKRGTSVEVYEGNTEERFYNDVPMTAKDYSEKIEALCEENIFKYITNPHYFLSQSKDKQRSMLFEMAGNVSDYDVAQHTQDKRFLALISETDASGKTLEEYKREIGAQKKRLKGEIATLPARIDECKRSQETELDWAEIDARIKELDNQANGIEKSIADIAEQAKAQSDAKIKLLDKINGYRRQIEERKGEIQRSVESDYWQAIRAHDEWKAKMTRAIANEKDNGYIIGEIQSQIDKYNAQLEKLRVEWSEIRKRELVFNESEFICPTCGRMLSPDDIEEKEDKLRSDYNAKKAQELEANKQQGVALSEKVKARNKELEKAQETQRLLQQTITELKASEPVVNEKPDATRAIDSDETIQELQSKVAELQGRYYQESTTQANDGRVELQNQLRDIRTQRGEQVALLSRRDAIEKSKNRIAELERQLQNQNAELAALEGEEFVMAEFNRAKVAMIEDRINSMFKTVRFKMFDTLINGSEIEVCEAMVNGVPWSDGLSAAESTKAGLDVIGTICNYVGVCAPIFIDNAEGINKIPEIDSQVISLFVTEDENLKITEA